MAYVVHLAIIFCLWAVLGIALYLPISFAGQLALGHVALFAIGAYADAWLMFHFTRNVVAALIAIGILGGLMSVTISCALARLRGDTFVLGSLTFFVLTYAVLYNSTKYTGGAFGLSDIPRPELLPGLELLSDQALLGIAVALLVAVLSLSWYVLSSPFGQAVRALREDETALNVLGRNSLAIKLWVFFLTGLFAAAAGAVYAGYMGYVDPNAFYLELLVAALAIVLIGGEDRLFAPVAGAVLVVLVPELLRFLPIPAPAIAPVRQMFYGAVLAAAAMLWHRRTAIGA